MKSRAVLGEGTRLFEALRLDDGEPHDDVLRFGVRAVADAPALVSDDAARLGVERLPVLQEVPPRLQVLEPRLVLLDRLLLLLSCDRRPRAAVDGVELVQGRGLLRM